MKLWGGWLPFIGFREKAYETDATDLEFLDNLEPPDGYFADYHVINTFEIEWFNICFAYVTGISTLMRKSK